MKGYIYKIEVGNDLYVGSSCDKRLCDRQAKHNYKMKKYPNRLLYKKHYENNLDKVKCILVKLVQVENINELRILEQKYIIELNATLNSQKAFQSKLSRKEYKKKYNEDNKEHLSNLRKIKVECPKCKSMVNKFNLNRHFKSKKCINYI
tara:strand:+ start:100 stop:546 length:447 start_codon:yes stop_codon:yes gene_type:complete